MAYIDTSVIVACYCPEPLSAAAERAVLADRAPSITRLVDLELHSAVALKLRTGRFDAGAAGRIVALFRQDVDLGRYRLLPIANADYDLARDWLARFSTPLRAVDALHLAAAFNNGLTLLTADRLLDRVAVLFGVRCRLIA